MEKNKNYIALCVCVISLVISVISLLLSLIAFWSSCEMEYNDYNAIMSAFSILVTLLVGLVTVLIAWQVYNHYVAKDEVKKMLEDEVAVVSLDIWNVLDSNDKANEDICLLSTNDVKDYQKIDVYMRSIEVAKKCKIDKLRDYSINYVLERFHKFYQNLDGNSEYHIVKGKRQEYEYLCEDISHKYIGELKSFIYQAKEFGKIT